MTAKCVGCVNMRGKIAIITASSSGIGEAIALRLAAAGASVCLSGCDESVLRNVQASCEKISPTNEKHFYVVGDLLIEKCREELISKTIKKYEKLDILINNIGGGMVIHSSILDGFTLTELDEAIDSPMAVNYGTAKLALEYFSKCLAVFVGSKHVRVNVVSPGRIITENAHERLGTTREKYDKAGIHALKRCGTPEEVAEVVAFLASDAASFVTGSTYLVDGGVSITASTSTG